MLDALIIQARYVFRYNRSIELGVVDGFLLEFQKQYFETFETRILFSKRITFFFLNVSAIINIL